MLPLCTSVTLFRLCFSAYLIARRTSRFVPVGEIGLMPTPESQRICFLPSFSMSLFKNSSSFFASGVPLFHSMPINVFRIHTENKYIQPFRMLHGGRNSLK